MCDIHRIATGAGVRLRNPRELRFGRRKPMVCYSKRVLRRIGQKHGAGHLALVLRLIVETGNGTELYSDTIKAISDVLAAHPELCDRGTQLYTDFDGINLGEIRSHAKALGLGLPLSHVMRVLIGMRLVAP